MTDGDQRPAVGGQTATDESQQSAGDGNGTSSHGAGTAPGRTESPGTVESREETETADPQITQIAQRVTNLEKLARGEAEEFRVHAARLTALEGLVDNLRARHAQLNEAVGRLEGDGQEAEDGGRKSEVDGAPFSHWPTFEEIALLLGRCRNAVQRPDGLPSLLTLDITSVMERMAGWKISFVQVL